MNLHRASIADVSRALRRREVGALELVEHHLARIEEHDGELNAYVYVARERALESARRADHRLMRGIESGPLAGIPIAVKDIVDVAGMPTRCQSRVMPDLPAQRSALAIERLEAQGAVVLGKTAMHEFATGWPDPRLLFPPARNPWNRAHHPGGSSSGSAVAVAAGMAMAAIGTDTAGSVRHPATACGIVGLKPTYDLVPRQGAFPLSFSLDHVGPLARTAEDCGLLLDAMADRRDPESYSAEIGQPIAGLRIGILDALHVEAGDMDPQIADAFDRALAALRGLGATLVPVRVPPFAAFQTCVRIIQQSESYAIHRAWLAARPGDYGATARERLAAGALVSAADFIVAQQARRELTARYREATRRLDAVIAVSSMFLPCAIDDATALSATYDRQVRGLFNVTGDPAIAIPAGLSREGLPLGVQLAAAPWCERRLLRIAHALQGELVATGFGPPQSAAQFKSEPIEGRA